MDTKEHRLQDTLLKLFDQLPEDDKYCLIADAHTLLQAAKLHFSLKREQNNLYRIK